MSPLERSLSVTDKIDMPLARFTIGEVVRHKLFDFRGVIFDVDPVFANSEEWYDSIPENLRPPKDPAPPQGPAVLPLARRELGERLHRLRQPAEPRPRRERGAGRPSGDLR